MQGLSLIYISIITLKKSIIMLLFFQAVCTWLLTILKHNSKRQGIIEKLSVIQSAFMDFLSENSGNFAYQLI